MVSLNGLKKYAVSFGETSDDELNLCLEAAVAWCENAGVYADPDNRLYDLLVYRLATFYHDHRGFPENGKDADMIGIGGIVLQLRVP